ncbi:MAG: hypothetical protein AAGF33_16645 [Pseudomonadota bacterium]
MIQRVVPLAGALALCLSGCATVTEFRGESSATVSLTEEQSALRQATDEFNETAEARGWVEKSGGLADLANILVTGQHETSAQDDYASLIGIGMRPTDEVMRTLASDAVDAASRLSHMSDMAETILLDEADVGVARSDLIAFEQAFVNARKCRRSFANAADNAAVVIPGTTEMALRAFDTEIDRADALADQLADMYSGRGTNTIS